MALTMSPSLMSGYSTDRSTMSIFTLASSPVTVKVPGRFAAGGEYSCAVTKPSISTPENELASPLSSDDASTLTTTRENGSPNCAAIRSISSCATLATKLSWNPDGAVAPRRTSIRVSAAITSRDTGLTDELPCSSETVIAGAALAQPWSGRLIARIGIADRGIGDDVERQGQDGPDRVEHRVELLFVDADRFEDHRYRALAPFEHDRRRRPADDLSLAGIERAFGGADIVAVGIE